MTMKFNGHGRFAAIALAATVAFAFVGAVSVEGFSNAVFAGKKSENGNGNNGNKGGVRAISNNGGGNNGNRGGEHRSNGHGQRLASVDEDATLLPREKGKWNANPNQNAIDAHIRNQNFNGTVGALAMFQLAHKLADPDYMPTEDELAAADALYEEYGISDTIPDEDQVSLLDLAIVDANEDSDAVYSYSFDEEAGEFTVSCDGGDACDDSTVVSLQDQADSIGFTGSEADLVAISEDVIRERSNKTYTPEKEETLLDGIADDLGVARDNTVDAFSDVGDAITDAGSALMGLLGGN